MCFFFQAEDGIRDLVRSRGLGDVYKRQDLQGAFADACVAAIDRTAGPDNEEELREQVNHINLSLIHI